MKKMRFPYPLAPEGENYFKGFVFCEALDPEDVSENDEYAPISEVSDDIEDPRNFVMALQALAPDCLLYGREQISLGAYERCDRGVTTKDIDGDSRTAAYALNKIQCRRSAKSEQDLLITGVVRYEDNAAHFLKVDSGAFKYKVEGFLKDARFKWFTVPSDNLNDLPPEYEIRQDGKRFITLPGSEPDSSQRAEVVDLEDFDLDAFEADPRKIILSLAPNQLPQLVETLFESPSEEDLQTAEALQKEKCDEYVEKVLAVEEQLLFHPLLPFWGLIVVAFSPRIFMKFSDFEGMRIFEGLLYTGVACCIYTIYLWWRTKVLKHRLKTLDPVDIRKKYVAGEERNVIFILLMIGILVAIGLFLSKYTLFLSLLLIIGFIALFSGKWSNLTEPGQFLAISCLIITIFMGGLVVAVKYEPRMGQEHIEDRLVSHVLKEPFREIQRDYPEFYERLIKLYRQDPTFSSNAEELIYYPVVKSATDLSSVYKIVYLPEDRVFEVTERKDGDGLSFIYLALCIHVGIFWGRQLYRHQWYHQQKLDNFPYHWQYYIQHLLTEKRTPKVVNSDHSLDGRCLTCNYEGKMEQLGSSITELLLVSTAFWLPMFVPCYFSIFWFDGSDSFLPIWLGGIFLGTLFIGRKNSTLQCPKCRTHVKEFFWKRRRTSRERWRFYQGYSFRVDLFALNTLWFGSAYILLIKYWDSFPYLSFVSFHGSGFFVGSRYVVSTEKIVFIGFLIISLLSGIFALFMSLRSETTLVSGEVIHIQGFFKKYKNDLPYHKLEWAQVEQGFILHLFGIGNIRLRYWGDRVVPEELVLAGMPHPWELWHLIEMQRLRAKEERQGEA